uniref:Uncharacterized protein n=1 Tax=Rhizophora mucronata TaxID=61149 RepID=A0A2P2PEG5_RHIMU
MAQILRSWWNKDAKPCKSEKIDYFMQTSTWTHKGLPCP